MMSAGYAFSSFDDEWVLEPSALLQITERTGEKAVDLNFRAFKKVNFGSIFGVLSFRQSFDGAEYMDGTQLKDQKLQYLTPVFGIYLRDFLFAYTYSYQMGNIKFDNGGYHQITLGYDFSKSGRGGKFDCNCPNVN